MPDIESQFGPNDIKQYLIYIDDVDITSMVLQTDIFQEIFNPVWSCQISFMDTQNLLMNIPVKVGSLIKIITETDFPKNSKKTFNFIVYKISDRVQISQEKQGYIINSISKEFFYNQKTRISKSFKNSTTNDIVRSITNEGLKSTLSRTNIDNHKYTLIIPNMAPFAAISWLSKFTMIDAADFWFYQVDDLKFAFDSFNSMLDNRSDVVFKQLNPNKLNAQKNIDDDLFINIEGFEFLTHHDTMANYSMGYYGSTTVNYDSFYKTITKTEYNYGDDIPLDKQYAPFDVDTLSNSQKSNIFYNPVHTNLYGTNVFSINNSGYEWMPSRRGNFSKLEDNRLLITVPGVVSHYELLGKQVDVELPSHQDISEEEYLDKYLKGSYVVTAIRHVITSDMYKNVIELGKKRLEETYG